MNKLLGLLTTGVLAAGLAAPPTAAAAQPPGPAGAADATGLAPGMVEAMRRDLGLTDREVVARLRVEAGATLIDRRLRARLGARYAGSWLTDGRRLTVAGSGPAAGAALPARGAG
ncbi:hypothetical protein ONA70_17760, partial [Micromonospora yasonensis]|nr:hypothetical protein [Micromonospora yasonensis]